MGAPRTAAPRSEFMEKVVTLRTVALAILVLLAFGQAAHARDVLVIQGLRIKPYDEALRGFRSSCSANTRTIVLAGEAEQGIARAVREEKPRLILAIGPEALSKAKKFRDIPVVYVMTLNPQAIAAGTPNVTGVSMNIPPERFLDLFGDITPAPRTIGVVYDPAKSGALVKRAQHAARSRGIRLVVREVHTPRDVPAALGSMGMVDALWMLPDTTVITPETVEMLILFSHRNSIPIFAFAAKYVNMGACASLDINGFEEGKQAGEMAAMILHGTAAADVPAIETRSVTLHVNRTVAKKLGISFGNMGRFSMSGKSGEQ